MKYIEQATVVRTTPLCFICNSEGYIKDTIFNKTPELLCASKTLIHRIEGEDSNFELKAWSNAKNLTNFALKLRHPTPFFNQFCLQILLSKLGPKPIL